MMKNSGNVIVYIRQGLNVNEFRCVLKNTKDVPVRLNEIKLKQFKISELGFSENAMVYADKYQMFDQTYIRLGEISFDTPSTDKDHYRFSQTEGCFTANNRFAPENQQLYDPIRMFPSDFRLWDPHMCREDDPKLFIFKGETYYLPFEQTICSRQPGTWFYCDNYETQPLQNIDEMIISDGWF